MPTGIHMPSRDALMLPDVLTEGDNLEMPPLPDASFLFSQIEEDNLPRKTRAGSGDINLQEDYTGSQFLQNSIENQEDDLALEPMDDLDLGLDFGLDFDDLDPKAVDRSVEIGRDAPAARAPEEDLVSELDVEVPAKDNSFAGGRDSSLNLDLGGGDFNNDDTIRMADDDGDVDMMNIGDGPDGTLGAVPLIRPERISESPLSDIDPEFAAQVEAEHARHLDSQLFEPEPEQDESTIVLPQRSRPKKVMRPDDETMIPKSQIKDQQEQHDKILRPQSSIPRNPALLALMEMQNNGAFVSNIMGEGRSAAWAPELRGMLSLDTIRQSSALKRKRHSGISDMGSNDERGAPKSPRLDLGEEEDLAAGLGGGDVDRENTAIAADGTIIEMPADDGDFMQNVDEEERDPSLGVSPAPNFDETSAPLVHPADSGPVSLGTKHAVHLLRDRFGAEAANSSDKRKKASVIFQDLLPEATTSKADATKMFFEVLVLATKDAVKVEQQEALLGGPIRVRGKRGLWGDWAEREAGGEIAEEEPAPAPAPHAELERSVAVAVAA